MPIQLAHALANRLAEVRKQNKADFLRPDGKTQVTVAYDGIKPVSVQTVVLSTQHDSYVSQQDLSAAMRELVIDPVLNEYGLDFATARVLINPSGNFVVGGPQADAGLTGRKIIVDTYGGYSRHGGGAFSGKDPSKVDRSAAYAMRWVAKNVVAAGLAERVEVQVAYAIGKAHPVGLYVETFGTHEVAPEKITKAIKEVFDLSPRGIIEGLDLLRPIYSQTATYGHFGRELDNFTWEQTNRVEQLRRATGD
jgi:S-adenosylmethionine synthetase